MNFCKKLLLNFKHDIAYMNIFSNLLQNFYQKDSKLLSVSKCNHMQNYDMQPAIIFSQSFFLNYT